MYSEQELERRERLLNKYVKANEGVSDTQRKLNEQQYTVVSKRFRK